MELGSIAGVFGTSFNHSVCVQEVAWEDYDEETS